MISIVLASASPARLAVLRGAGLEPKVMVSGVDEAAVDAASTTELVMRLAEAKAAAVAASLPAATSPACDEAVVLGCDSLLDLDGRPLGKPGNAREAIDRWRAMSGRAGTLATGHCVINVATGQRATGCAQTTVRFGTPSEHEIAAYVNTGEPLAVAGGFTLEGRGGWFIESIDGDYSNVLGISLPLTRKLLATLGIDVTTLWSN